LLRSVLQTQFLQRVGIDDIVGPLAQLIRR
jgi:hypothetical protein